VSAKKRRSSLSNGVESYLNVSKEGRKNDDRRFEAIKAAHEENKKREYSVVLDDMTLSHTGNADLPMLDLVRHLFNVSTNFRHELGHVFWARTRIMVPEFAYDLAELLDFFKERPAIHKSIKVLNFDCEMIGDSDFYAKESKKTFKQVKKWELEYFNMEAMICERQLPALASGLGVFKKLSMIQDLKVAKGVESGLYMMADDVDLVDDEDSDAEYNHCEASVEYLPTIRDFIIPKALRSKGLGDNVHIRLRVCGGDYLDEEL
jgi:hypothetical protein